MSTTDDLFATKTVYMEYSVGCETYIYIINCLIFVLILKPFLSGLSAFGSCLLRICDTPAEAPVHNRT